MTTSTTPTTVPSFTPIPEATWQRAERNQRFREFWDRISNVSHPTTLAKIEGRWKIVLNKRH